MRVEAISRALPELLSWAEMDPEDRMSPIAQQAFCAGWEAAGRSAEPAPYEQVNSPSHYQMPGGVEVIDLVEHLSFNCGNSIKYAARAGRKPGAEAVTDLRKSIWYLEREIARLGEQP